MKDNKNRYALAFMGMLLKAGWFQQSFWHYGQEYHGKNLLDQMFSTIKGYLRRNEASSIPSLNDRVQTGKSGIVVLELLTLIDVHTMSKPVWPSGLQDFHFWHLYNSKDGVKLRAREYFKHTVHAPAATQPWRGTQQGSSLLVISHDAPLPELRFFTPQLTDKAFLSKITDILHTPRLLQQPQDKDFWAGFVIRYGPAPTLSWSTPTAPFISLLPTEQGIAEVITSLNLSANEAGRIQPLPVKWFYTSAKAKSDFESMSTPELLRRSLEGVSRELLEPGAAVAKVPAKRRRVTARAWPTQYTLRSCSLLA